MNEKLLELFRFLEQSPYFYEKRDEFIAEPGGVKNNRIIYTFYAQDKPCQSIAEITIPLENPFESINWKYVQINERNNKLAVQQVANEHLSFIPNWFKMLVQKTSALYQDLTTIVRAFA